MINDRVADELRTALASLKEERAELDEQIDAMERMLSRLGVSEGGGRRKATRKKTTRKRKASPAKRKATKKKTGRKKKKPNWTPEAREAARLRMKKYWADRRKKKR